MSLEIIQWVVSEPDPESICTLCKNNVAKKYLITCPEKINICLSCADLLKIIAIEKEGEIKEEAIDAMLEVEKKLHDCYEPRDLMQQLYNEGYRKEEKDG